MQFISGLKSNFTRLYENIAFLPFTLRIKRRFNYTFDPISIVVM